MSVQSRIDYLVVGHIANDITPHGRVVGGTAAYAGRTAHTLSCHTAVLTSCHSDYPCEEALPGIDVHVVPAPETTVFENIYTSGGRQQRVHTVAQPLTAAHIPPQWRRARIVHLAPIVNEVAPRMIEQFSNSLVGLTPQGWMRCWDEDGRVSSCEWPEAADILPLAAAVILSREDLPDETTLDRYRQWARLLVLTQGAAGCIVFFNGEVRQVPAPSVAEVEPTGAGDVFAAAFLIRLHQTNGNPWEAARFANEIAAQSVTQTGLDAKIKKIK